MFYSSMLLFLILHQKVKSSRRPTVAIREETLIIKDGVDARWEQGIRLKVAQNAM